MQTLNEPKLSDDYPVYVGYAYVADGNVIYSNIKGTVADLKLRGNFSNICRCDLVGRDLV